MPARQPEIDAALSAAVVAVVPPELVFAVQPRRDTLVWQQNRLAEARYKLNVREQKLLLYVISMIEPEAQDFGKCRVSVQGYAEMTGLQPDDLYQELRDTALSIREKTLVVDGVLEPGMRRAVRRHGSWFEYVDEASGDGFVTIKLSSWLKPFLLQVRREFFKYQLTYALDLKSEYSIRLYQWLKRWQYAGKKTESLVLLRLHLGATEVNHEGQVVRENLAAYKHFKNKALTPALAEINARTDLCVSVREEKVKGSKAVGAIAFSIRPNAANQAALAPVKLPVPRAQPQLELVLESAGEADGSPAPPGPVVAKGEAAAAVVVAEEKLAGADEEIDALVGEFGLGPRQRDSIQKYVGERGADYVRQKAQITRSAPRDNAARTFLAALKGDWQAPKQIGKKAAAEGAAKAAQRSPASGSEGAAPKGWREFLQRKYPEAQVPKTWKELGERFPSLVMETREITRD